MVFFLVFLPAAHHECIVMTAFGFLCVPVYDSSHFLVQDAVVNVGFLGMEVFVKGGSNHAVRVDNDAELFGDLAYVCIVPA